MRPFRLALAQVNPTVGDLEGNVGKVLSNVELARSCDVDLIAFPELILTGYPPEDLLLRPGFVQDGINALRHVVSKCNDIVVVLGFVDTEGNLLDKILGGLKAAFVGFFGGFMDLGIMLEDAIESDVVI